MMKEYPAITRMLIPALFFVMVVKLTCASLTEAPPTLESGSQCLDIGLSRSMRVIAGESGRIPCPPFSFPTLYSYNQSSGQTLLWYRHTDTHELEEPIHLRTHRFLKYRDSLWIQPTTLQDSGLYICMLRNNSSCVKMGVQLQVFARVGMCDSAVHQNITVPLDSQYTLRCPDQQHLPTNSTHNVTWYHKCMKEFTVPREVKGDELVIYIMYDHYAGPYTCVVSYQSGGHTLQFTRTINIRAVPPRRGTKHPRILNPASGQIYKVTLGEDAELTCRVFLPYLDDEEGLVWWTIDNKTVKELGDPRYSSPETRVEDDNDDNKTVLTMLRVKEFSAADLLREFRCSAQNSRGLNFSIATLEKEVYIPTVELACGLGVTLALAVLLIVLYRVFKLEVHLLYRTWFGTDERNIDDKEYDVYISYARNGEEEEFVMTTLRRVLEVDLGYTVCIFDRDSLPGGTITDETLRFVGRSRRLVVVVSSLSAVRGTQALLELKAGLEMLRGGRLRVVLIQYKPVQKECWVKELRRARIALALIRWKGEKSVPLSSCFWKELQLQLPIRSNTNQTQYKHKEETTALIMDTIHTPDSHTQTSVTNKTHS
ncbi:interleukin-1 receptor accessory protein isoform X2 [Astyanax mexicanus]|uniref:interleukin-1 receptor accessory protein isoform X2 n=1 Tax=Astyanax mexicanus TaxID=7994 RepID=UPI0020CB59B9|nr:interleukin-1 receptor accessory protein isoform X2 [Astyanax mexicanus]